MTTTGIDTDGILTKNPFRYRGYYYDRETGFYATGARYYDPQIGRFISADNLIASVGSSVQGHNLFAYCFSNPVNMSDSTGQWPRELTLGVGIAALTIGALAPEVIVGAMVVAAVSGIVFGIQSLHYDAREVLNEGVPEKESESTQPDWIGPPNSPSAVCHQFSAPSKAKENVKYVSKDGHKEVIYDYNGLKVTDSRDIGTYNFCPSGTMWGDAGHVCVDILPWVIFGNDDSDPGPGINIINSWLN